jgi:hypothetical protein
LDASERHDTNSRGERENNIVCVAGYLFLFLLLYVSYSLWHSSGGWMAMASNGRRGKKSRFILEHGTQ